MKIAIIVPPPDVAVRRVADVITYALAHNAEEVMEYFGKGLSLEELALLECCLHATADQLEHLIPIVATALAERGVLIRFETEIPQ